MLKFNSSKMKRDKIALTFLEIVISLSLVAIVFVGLAQIFQVGMMSVYKTNQEIIATDLARSLMAEIMSKIFYDPQDHNNTALGINTGETSGNKLTFDDVDDYNGYIESPPRTINGSAMDGTAGTPNYSAFTRSVVVQYVDENMSWTASPTDYKKVEVTVTAPGRPNVVLTEVKVYQPDSCDCYPGGGSCCDGCHYLAVGTICGGTCDTCNVNGSCISGGTQVTCYQDNDGDGYGAGSAQTFCGSCPTGYALTNNDCCDTDNTTHPNATLYYGWTNNCGSFDYNCNGSVEKSSNCTGIKVTGMTFSGPVSGCPITGYTSRTTTCQATGTLSCGDNYTVSMHTGAYTASCTTTTIIDDCSSLGVGSHTLSCVAGQTISCCCSGGPDLHSKCTCR